ncbi:SAM-dependent methyltransferase [Rhodopirellula sp. MGV]|uniref:SAM-dependent methyltransferase n=1 Tax=Rhodopirellula sp. MGV TaxID=2023130 RepID=UPI000B978053|nr:class I SAM-dependent methyltransferase [Rhodopirellula sp. MGV]OYP32972.1 hypothetical protein CGZ80_18910 [Rhodopirellula sp. MGV]PNY35371.1 class I SAM-dependent methyltransferase [Rhodopirellula baltica]
MLKISRRLMLGGLVCCCAFSNADEPYRSKEDSAIHVPTPRDVVDRMLALARVTKQDMLVDLGCGDGRVVVAAAKRYGCHAEGFEIDARKVAESRENVKTAGTEKLVRITQKDIFDVDLRKATVVTLYLLPEMNEKLIPQLRQMPDNARIVCHDFPIEGIKVTQTESMKSVDDGGPHTIYLYRLPLQDK